MSLLSAILPVQAAVGAVSTIARALRPGAGADFTEALRQSMGQKFTNRFDADKNGTVSPNEFPGKPELFAQWDQDSNGSISAAEAHAALTQLAETQRIKAAGREDWALYDSDHSGSLTQAEAGLPQKEFRPLDTDRDGFLSRNEWLSARGLADPGLIR